MIVAWPREVGGSPHGILLSPSMETSQSHGQYPIGCEPCTAALDIVMLLQAGVSLMVAWGGLLREDLQPRANVRKGSLVQVWRKGMLCRRIAITV